VVAWTARFTLDWISVGLMSLLIHSAYCFCDMKAGVQTARLEQLAVAGLGGEVLRRGENLKAELEPSVVARETALCTPESAGEAW